MEITKTRLVVFDLETTNPPENYQKHEIIEIAAIEVKESKINNRKTFYSLVKPPCKIQPHNFRVSGISDEMVKGAPSINKVVPLFLDFVGNVPLVAHNISFDARVFNENLIAIGHNELSNILLCTFVLSKKLYPEEKSHGLDAVMGRFGIEVAVGQRHRALDDVEATAKVFLKMLDVLKQNYIVTLEDINRFCNTDAEVGDFQQLKLF